MSVMVNHNYPDADDLRVLDSAGEPIDGVTVTIFTLENYDAGIVDEWVGVTETDTNGRWEAPILVAEDTSFIVHFEKPTMYGPVTLEITT
jgi:5-hydroxyisourate hydrolase-like protein (transthyretin family)